MREAVPVAFYAPLKSPHHPSPSGDRTMARLLLKGLAAAGFAPVLASEMRTFDGRGDALVQERVRTESLAEADRLIAAYRDRPTDQRPRLWFTYHVYYKAPDWIGPRVADALRIPYAIAEGSRAGKRAGGPWQRTHAGAEAALGRADVVFVMTEADKPALARARPATQRLVDLPPFIDLDDWPPIAPRKHERAGLRFLTVAMMRPGDKLASYRILASALERLADSDWTLDVVGDGNARREVEPLFARLGSRVAFHGQVDDRARLAELYGQSDLLLWPAVNEAYGLALLEAQAFGCPVVGGAYGGVASVVRDGETGILTPPGDAAAFAAAVAALIADPNRRRALAAAAGRFVAAERGLQPAAERLRSALMPLVESAGSSAARA
jgi:glycosyltransferase involved in cell wall biosynthesis